jgi:predicted alternative tryptophan synthase beta-subunit
MAKTKILNLADAPTDPIRRIVWLSGVVEAVTAELDNEFAATYYEARLEGALPAAVAAGPHAMKRVLRYTRQENDRRGRSVRWNDGLDPASR